MNLSFNTAGNLHETVELTFEEFQQYFGFNEGRKEKIKVAEKFLRIFSSCGSKAMYIAGSFVSKKINPEDIDLCFDMREVDDEKLKKEFPEFRDANRHIIISKIRRDLKCHIFAFEDDDEDMFRNLQYDRLDFPKGLVKINL